MSELIPVKQGNIGGDIVQTVNARELHSFLEVGRDFPAWIKDRIRQYDFQDGKDYCLSPAEKGEAQPSGFAANKIEYHLALDMAKELSMIERNEKGKEARKYFIECEKRLKKAFILPDFTNPAIAARAWADECEKKMLAEAKVLELQPKAEFFDAVTGSSDAVDIGTVAKVLNMGVGRNSLFEILRNESVLMSNNQPFQRHIDSGYFRLIEQKYSKPDGSTHISIKTVVYQKGICFIRKKLIELQSTRD